MPEPDYDKLYPVDPRKAREQAADLLGFLASRRFDIGGGETWELPLRDYMDTAMRKRLRAHERYMKTMDKETQAHPVTGKEVERFVTPFEKNGKDVDSDELMCIALMGDTDGYVEVEGLELPIDYAAYLESGDLPEVYVRFLRAGGVPGQVLMHLNEMAQRIADRTKIDSKSR